MNLQEKVTELSKIYSASPIAASSYAQNGKIYFLENGIPAKKLENARKKFVLREGETIIYFYDQTFRGTGDQGFCVTDKTIYWRRTALSRAQSVPLAEIADIKRELHDEDRNDYHIMIYTGKANLDTWIDADSMIFDFLKEVFSILRVN